SWPLFGGSWGSCPNDDYGPWDARIRVWPSTIGLSVERFKHPLYKGSQGEQQRNILPPRLGFHLLFCSIVLRLDCRLPEAPVLQFLHHIVAILVCHLLEGQFNDLLVAELDIFSRPPLIGWRGLLGRVA